MSQCRFCRHALSDVVIDLGASPLANSYIPPERQMEMEAFYPLKVYFCGHCGLVQLQDFASPEDIFSDYGYFSSYSETWLSHARAYVEHMMRDYGIGPHSQVLEVASNDGYLLQYFLKEGVKCLGVEPAANVASEARKKGVPTETCFFGVKTAELLRQKGYAADLVLGNNVLAHVPDINDFVAGFKAILKPEGFLTVEFPHLLRLIEGLQFDTIYHEHFSYLSLGTVKKIFAAHGLNIFQVEELPTHGGSLRVFACRQDQGRPVSEQVEGILTQERKAALERFSGYQDFAASCLKIKLDLLDFLIAARRANKKVVAYGAAAKGNTLLNYAGVRPDLVWAVADKSPHKQGKLLPGTRIPVLAPDYIKQSRPDYMLILPWNIKEEIMVQLAFISDWGGRFVTAVPELKVWP